MCFCLRSLNFYPRSPCGERPIYGTRCQFGSNFYPRSPCGERLCGAASIAARYCHFYPRSPCGERPLRPGRCATRTRFLSTLSLRRATIGLRCVGVFLGISIHALLAESDWRTCAACTAKQYFYPRSPCGERLAYFQPHALSVLFLSTLSLRRATRFQCGAIQHNKDFYPRSPCGERPPYFSQPATLFKFLSTLSLRRATAPA